MQGAFYILELGAPIFGQVHLFSDTQIEEKHIFCYSIFFVEIGLDFNVHSL